MTTDNMIYGPKDMEEIKLNPIRWHLSGVIKSL